jgi:hypothetical protein
VLKAVFCVNEAREQEGIEKMKKELELARAILLKELVGTTQGSGFLFQVDYTLLVKIAQLVRLEGKHPLSNLLGEIAMQQPDWRFEEETGQGTTYWTAVQFAEQHRDLLHVTAWLIVQPDKPQAIVATVHLDDGSLFVLVVSDKCTRGNRLA